VKNIKVLGNGKLEKNLIICAHKFSKSAEKGIVEAGGKIEVI
jgi:large subunit ribosomal protein L15